MDRYLLEPEKAHPTGEFVIVAKFGDHVLCHLATRLANVIREGERQTKNLFLNFFLSPLVFSTSGGMGTSTTVTYTVSVWLFSCSSSGRLRTVK